MLILIVAAGCFFFFCLTVVLLAIAYRLELRPAHHTFGLRSRKTRTLLSLTQAFDPVYTVLWDAPISALRLLESAGRGGLPPFRLRPIFDKAAASFPEIYEGHSFSDWLDVLQENQFISGNSKRIRLAPEGKVFLSKRFVTDAMIEAEEYELEEATQLHVE